MNPLKSVFPLLLIISSLLFGQENFVRNLPDDNMLKLINTTNFPDCDAVIIVKEQSFQVTTDAVYYYGYDIPAKKTIYNKVIIAKLFNESAVKRYGTFEYEYYEPYGDEFKNGFQAKARVKKANGEVFVMPQEDVKIVVSNQDKKGRPLTRKAMFHVPNLAAGDVIQIEYTTVNVFSSSSSEIFFYNDEDFVLFSNVYITLPAKKDYIFKSYPADKVGEPKTQQFSKNFGDGETYFWSMKNLSPMPSDPFSLPFADRSMITCFYQVQRHGIDKGNWNGIAEGYFDHILDKGSVDSDDIERLGFQEEEENVTMGKIDSLYTALRKHFVIDKYNVIYPRLEDLDDLFEDKRGDASDLAFIMYKILEGWNVNAKGVLIRDRREGNYEMEVPAMMWFDRLALLVQVDGKEKLYDFDRSLPNIQENPWYLNNVNMPVIDENSCSHKKFTFADAPENNISSEIHRLKFNSETEMSDSLELSYTGSFAQRMRQKLYGMEKGSVNDFFKDKIKSCSITSPGFVLANNYMDESRIAVTASGTSSFKCEAIDSFLTVNVANTVLSDFRNKLYSAKRTNDIYFDSKLSFLMKYEIPVPDGYKLYQKPSGISKTIQAGLSFTMNYTVEGNKIIITARENIESTAMPVAKYNEIIKHLDSTIEITGKGLIFVKNKPASNI